MKSLKVLSRISDKLKFWVTFGWLPVEDPDFPHMIFQVPYEKLSVSAQQALNDHIQLWQYLGYQVIIEPLTEQIPPGCIGLMIRQNEGKQEYRRYLQTQVEYVEKTEIVYQKPDSSVQLTV